MSSSLAKNTANIIWDKTLKWAKARKWLVISIIIVLVLIYDTSPLGGNAKFYSKWIECGQKPVATNTEWSIGGGTPPHYGIPPTFSLMRLSSEYFCTPLEAEQAGYSSSSERYEFPNLNTNQN